MAESEPQVECPRCQGPLVSIELSLDGRELLMQSCSRCDIRWWLHDGEDVELTKVLGREPTRQPALR